jgi:hypothetical protein
MIKTQVVLGWVTIVAVWVLLGLVERAGASEKLYDARSGKELPSTRTECPECQIYNYEGDKWRCASRAEAEKFDGPSACPRKQQFFDSGSGKQLPSPNPKCGERQVFKRAKWQCADRNAATAFDGPAVCGHGAQQQFRNLSVATE